MYNKAHMYDATEIFRTLPTHQKEAYFKIAFYLLSFFYYLYRCAVPSYANGQLLIGYHTLQDDCCVHR